jgi:branched-chain amino acid transport system ATP-binding protein
MRELGITILLVEQMATQALGAADRAYVLETGRITLEGGGTELLNNPHVKAAYLGGH